MAQLLPSRHHGAAIRSGLDGVLDGRWKRRERPAAPPLNRGRSHGSQHFRKRTSSHEGRAGQGVLAGSSSSLGKVAARVRPRRERAIPGCGNQLEAGLHCRLAGDRAMKLSRATEKGFQEMSPADLCRETGPTPGHWPDSSPEPAPPPVPCCRAAAAAPPKSDWERGGFSRSTRASKVLASRPRTSASLEGGGAVREGGAGQNERPPGPSSGRGGVLKRTFAGASSPTWRAKDPAGGNTARGVAGP